MPLVVPALLKAWNSTPHSSSQGSPCLQPTQGSSFIFFFFTPLEIMCPSHTSVWCSQAILCFWTFVQVTSTLGWHFSNFSPYPSRFNSNDISFTASSLTSTAISCSLFYSHHTPFSDSQTFLAYITVVYLNFSTSLYCNYVLCVCLALSTMGSLMSRTQYMLAEQMNYKRCSANVTFICGAW